MTYALRTTSLTQTFSGAEPVTALRDVSVAIEPGEFVAVMGPSGSGKSTLLACMAGLQQPSSGQVEIGGVALGGMNDDELTELRRTRIGFVFQDYNLLPGLSAFENITLPATLGKGEVNEKRAFQLAARLGISERLEHRPAQLSGGQQQRVAIARALLMEPSIILADEPTGALDTVSAGEVLSILVDEAERGQAIAVVTHDPIVASYASRVIYLRDGQVAAEERGQSAEAVSQTLVGLLR